MVRQRLHRRGSRGVTSIALVVMVVMVFVAMTGLVFSLVSSGVERTQGQEASGKAYLVATNRIARVEALIMSADESLDSNDDGIINGLDTVAGNWVTVEDDATGRLMVYGNLRQFDSPPSIQEHFVVRASGIYDGAYRAIEAKLGYLSFLKFARFCGTNLSYGEGAVLTGMVYADGNITVPDGNDGPYVTFKRDVIATGTLSPKSDGVGDGHTWENVVVEGTLEEHSSKQYSLNIPQQFAFYKSSAQSEYGMYIDTTTDNYFENGHSQVSGSTGDNLIDLSKFKELGTANAFYDVNDDDVYTAGTDLDLPDDFNGVFYWDGYNKVHVKGHLTGQSISIFSDYDIIIDGSITTGSDADGMPVNLGLISDERVLWSQYIHSIFNVDAGIFAANSRHHGTYSAGYGTEDTDYSTYNPDYNDSHGSSGETANPPWYFRIYGPIIVNLGGDNGGWIKYGALTGQTTRSFNYDVDISTFPPPFPIVEGVLLTLSHREIEDRL